MENVTHTPGPWTISSRPNPALPKDTIHEINFGTDGECVAEIVHESADARLIVQAPVMLQALKSSTEALRSAGTNYADMICDLNTKLIAGIEGKS